MHHHGLQGEQSGNFLLQDEQGDGIGSLLSRVSTYNSIGLQVGGKQPALLCRIQLIAVLVVTPTSLPFLGCLCGGSLAA